MIAEAIDKLLEETTARRPAKIEENGRLWFFNDVERKYEEIPLEYVRRHTVSNMESFIALVKEEGHRLRDRSPRGVVTLTKTGGLFVPEDTGNGKIRHTYARALDPFWQIVAGNIGKPMPHGQFVRFLTSLAPVIENYPTVARHFRKVFFDERLNVTSQPMLDADGKGGNSFSVEFIARGGTQTASTALPAGFLLKLPYARGSYHKYDVFLELDLTLRKDNDKNHLMFSYYCPSLSASEVEAQGDEERMCVGELKALDNILVLTNYQ
jgi:hypothetical protein